MHVVLDLKIIQFVEHVTLFEDHQIESQFEHFKIICRLRLQLKVDNIDVQCYIPYMWSAKKLVFCPPYKTNRHPIKDSWYGIWRLCPHLKCYMYSNRYS